MTNEFQYTIEWTIKPGQIDAFKELANTAIKQVQDNEPLMKGYQWYFNDDESKCYTAEWQSNSDSFLVHLQNVSEVLPALLGCSDISRFEVFGNPSNEAVEVLSGLGAQIFGYFNGFTR